MKKLNIKLLSFILAVVTILTSAPFIAHAFNQDTSAQTLVVLYNNEPVEKTLILAGNETLTLKAEDKKLDKYQWQILIPSVNAYVNVADMTDKTCRISYALIENALNENNQASIRLTGEKNGITMTSASVWISYYENLDSLTKEVPAEADTKAEAEDKEDKGFMAKLRSSISSFFIKIVNVFASGDISIPACDCGYVGSLTSHEIDCAKRRYIVDELGNGTYTAEEIFTALKGTPIIEQYQIADLIGQREHHVADELRELIDDAAGNLVTHTVTIKYQYNNEGPSIQGSVTANYVATIAEDSDFIETIINPIRTGYKAYIATESDWNEAEGQWFFGRDESTLTNGEELDVNIHDISEDAVYYIIYMPQLVPYTVISYKQNVYNDFYTYHATNVYEGTNGALVGSSVLAAVGGLLDIPGFTRLSYEDAKVAADGSTIIELYYDREYRLMNFDLGDGGYGVEPVYARYGTSFNVVNPTRAGYDFINWTVDYAYNGYDTNGDPVKLTLDDSAYTTAKKTALENLNNGNVDIPEFDVMFKANWDPHPNVGCTIAYWRQDTVGDTYSYWGKKEIQNVSAGDTFDVEIDVGLGMPASSVVNADSSVGLEDYKYFTYNSDKTLQENGTTVEVNGEGSTIINVYYTRNEYTIRYVYARASGTGTSYVRVNSITSGSTYYIQNARSNNYLTRNSLGNGIATTQTPLEITLTNSPGTDYYTVTYKRNNTTYYLSFANNSAQWTTTETLIHITNVNNQWRLRHYNSGTLYLNDHGGGGDDAKGWDSGSAAGDDGSQWYLCSTTETETNYTGIQVATLTGRGYNNVSFDQNSIQWSGKTILPDVIDDKFTQKTFVNSADGRLYFYVDVTARYGADIEDMWPQDAIGPTNGAAFGSWAASAASMYRKNYSDANANIVGPYPTMSYEMIEDPNNPIAQTMVAWWSATNDISDHTYNIYVEAYEGQNLDGKVTLTTEIDGKNVTFVQMKSHEFSCAHNGNTRCDPIVYDGRNCVSPGWSGAVLTNRNTSNANYITYSYYYSDGGTGRTNGTLYVSRTNGFDSYISFSNGTGSSVTEYVYLTEDDIFEKSSGNYYVHTNHFFYTRNTYAFSYYNRGFDKKPEGDPALMFGTKLNSLHVVTDDQMQTDYYPDTLEEDAYTFEGWYLTPECLPGTEVDWNTLTMPAAPLEVYAGWFPVDRTVTFYETYADYLSDTPKDVFTVDHGSPVQYDSTISRPGYLFVGWFYFDGASDTKVAFLPNNIPVTKDMKIFAEWQNQESLIKYTIKYIAWQGNKDSSGEYVLDHCVIGIDGETGEPIFGGADPNDAMEISTRTTGQFQEGRTKTFSAKAIPQLYPEFQQRYFPLLSSHAIMFVKDQDFSADEDLTLVEHGDGTYELIYTFNYIYLESMSYTVNYINTETGDNTFEVDGHEYTAAPKTTTTTEAITTQRFLQINGYIPDEYQKQLVLTADPTLNVINFYYSKSTQPMYFVVHMTENLDGTWTEEKKEFGMASVGSVITRSADPAGTYPGHSYDPNFGLDIETGEYTWVTTEGLPITDQPGHGDLWVPDDNTINQSNHYYRADTSSGTGTVSAALVEYHTIVIRFYYTLDSYGYRIEHKRYETNQWLDDSGQLASTDNILSVDPIVYKTKLKYGETFTGYSRNALDKGFWVDGHEDGSIVPYSKKISDNEENNVITIWYIDSPVEINYVMVIDDTIPSTDAEKMGNSLSITLSNTRAHSGYMSIVGSQPTVAYGYRFDGWYQDANCKMPVNESWVDENNKLQPQQLSIVLSSATYYAHFVPLNSSLTISKRGLDAEDSDRISLFRIVGDPSGTYTKKVDLTVAIQGNGDEFISFLPLGSYTVTELTAWTWDYDSAQAEQTVQVKPIDAVNTENRVTFTESRAAGFIKWLAEESYVRKLFKDLVM